MLSPSQYQRCTSGRISSSGTPHGDTRIRASRRMPRTPCRVASKRQPCTIVPTMTSRAYQVESVLEPAPAKTGEAYVFRGPVRRRLSAEQYCDAVAAITLVPLWLWLLPGWLLAGLALSLAGVGIYGVMSYLVNQRVKEIGIRMALGAGGPAVLRSVVLQSLRPVIVGMAVGVAGAAAMSSLLHTTLVFPGSFDVLYGVPFYDPATFLGLGTFLIVVAALASFGPARRAVRIDPMMALRCD